MLDCGLPFAKIGDGGAPLVVLDSFRVEHRTADGLVLQGMMSAYEPYTEAGRTVYLLERPIEMPIDYTFDDMRDDYIAGLAEVAAGTGGGLDVIGVGAGGMFALAVAAELGRRGREGRPSPLLRRQVIVAAAPRMSERARVAAARWQSAAEKLRWRAVHREIVAMSYTGSAALFYGALAWAFPGLQGTSDYPWDFAITVREVANADLSERLTDVQVPTLFLAGAADRLFSSDEIADAAARVPGGESRILPRAGHAIVKSRRRMVERAILRFLSDSSMSDQSMPRPVPRRTRRSRAASETSPRHSSGNTR